MKVLWFTNTPCTAIEKLGQTSSSGGWLTALSNELIKSGNIELHIAFYWDKIVQPFKYKGIYYHPILRSSTGNRIERTIRRFKSIYLKTDSTDEIGYCKEVVESIKPDIVHIHGTEENFGLICKEIAYPNVISIQGLLSSINHKLFAGYTKENIKRHEPILHKLMFCGINSTEKLMHANAEREKTILAHCNNIIGRTKWDYDCTLALNPKRKYFKCNELIREEFHQYKWLPPFNEKVIHLATTISSGIYKGIETIYRTAYQLNRAGVNIVWNIVGISPTDNIIRATEKLLGYSHKEINIKLCGRKSASEIVEILKEANIYVQASHIENSPNNICEAMLLGMPIIATMAGGTSSLLVDNHEGYLIQDGDPYSMAGAILHCKENYNEAIEFGENARRKAIIRHNPTDVTKEILNIYTEVIRQYEQN